MEKPVPSGSKKLAAQPSRLGEGDVLGGTFFVALRVRLLANAVDLFVFLGVEIQQGAKAEEV